MWSRRFFFRFEVNLIVVLWLKTKFASLCVLRNVSVGDCWQRDVRYRVTRGGSPFRASEKITSITDNRCSSSYQVIYIYMLIASCHANYGNLESFCKRKKSLYDKTKWCNMYAKTFLRIRKSTFPFNDLPPSNQIWFLISRTSRGEAW